MRTAFLTLGMAVLFVAAVVSAQDRVGPSEIYPNQLAQPGASNPDITQDNIAETICNREWKTGSIRPPTAYTTKLKKKQMIEYGFTVPDAKKKCMESSGNLGCYEEDHIISITLAGSPTSPKNLWPEAYKSTVNGVLVGAREKDQVEMALANAVCFDIPDAKKESSKFKVTRSITLERAQEIISTDWYSCYLSLLSSMACD